VGAFYLQNNFITQYIVNISILKFSAERRCWRLKTKITINAQSWCKNK